MGSPLPSIQTSESRSACWFETSLPVLILILGLLARLHPAFRLFLNPDEALHNLLASQTSLRLAYNAALTNAHPPLLILLLYYWRAMGHSELWLRLPSVLAGTTAAWLLYRWLKVIAGRATALMGLLLASLAPSLVGIAAEIRQYALLLFFIAACLYLSEMALQKNSPGRMILFSVSLCGAILTHYSALMFAFTIGVYLLIRLYPYRDRLSLVATWAGGQVVAAALAAYFLLTHLPRLRQSGMVRADLDSYLRKATFHAGERNPVEFLASQTLRVFTYTLSHGLIGTLALLAFLAGIFWLLRAKESGPGKTPTGPSPRQLALLLGLPFLVTWGVTLAGLYPLGATRHSSFLAPFIVAGVSVGLAGCVPVRESIKSVVLALCLGVCTFFPAPPPAIRARNQSAAHMRDAVAYVRASVPTHSTILADYESGLLLGYYLCGHGVVQIFPPQQPLAPADCGPYSIVATSFRDWRFVPDNFSGYVASADRGLSSDRDLWLFYAGWINDSTPLLRQDLSRFGCPAPQSFGENILICRLSRPRAALTKQE